MPITVFHNPSCTKSRGTLELLKERGLECDVIQYLQTPPNRATLEELIGMLNGAPTELVRRDGRFAELGLDDAGCASKQQVVELLLAHPELMERPVVVKEGRAVIARPIERVLELLD